MILLRDGKVLTVFEEKSIHLNSIILTVVLGYLEHGWTRMETRKSIRKLSKYFNQTENRRCQEGSGREWEWTGSLGLVDTSYYIWNGETIRSYCIAQRTISSLLG